MFINILFDHYTFWIFSIFLYVIRVEIFQKCLNIDNDRFIVMLQNQKGALRLVLNFRIVLYIERDPMIVVSFSKYL